MTATTPVTAIIDGTNADLIAACARLGYLRPEIATLDVTYKHGRFWRKWKPDTLVGSDLDPRFSPVGYPVDFTALPWADQSFGQVVIDGPYQLNGTSSGKGPAAKDEDYGVDDRWKSPEERHDLIKRGMAECARVLTPATRVRVDKGKYELHGGTLLVKCQAQVAVSTVWWQDWIFASYAEARLGLVLEDMFLLRGLRAQPSRTRKHGDCAGRGCDGCEGGRVKSKQEHAARNYSTLLVLRRPPT